MYTIYNPITGEIISTMGYSSSEEATAVLGTSSYIDGNYPGNQYYINVDTKQPVSIPSKPTTTLDQYTFNWSTHTWDINLDATAALMRAKRDSLLNQTVDQVNPVWYASLTQEQQQELSTYRQALLDVPQQSGWPTDVSWPTKPTWM